MCSQFFIPNSKLLGITLSTESSVQLGWPATFPKARAPTLIAWDIGGVDRARAGPSGESCRRERAIPPGTPVGEPRHRAPPVLPGVADAGSKPHAAARVGKRGEMGDGAARGRLARESGLERPIDLRCAGWWAATERCVGAGAEGWGWEGCGRPTERDARDHALGRRRRKRPLADLAAQASGVSAHACCRARVIISAG